MKFQVCQFSDLFAEPPRNGVYKAKEFLGKGVKFVRMKELFAYEKISSKYSSYELIELTDNEKTKVLLSRGDLIFSRTSVKADGIGKCSIVTDVSEAITFDSNMIRFRLDEQKAAAPFYFYFFSSPQGRDQVRSLASGAAITTVTGVGIGSLSVPLTDMSTQCKIASILSSYDDLIENNTRRIKILEEMARMIYREWFVNFRFPGHEQVKMVDSPLGLIPEGWEVKPVTESVEVNPRTKVPVEGEKTFVSMGSLSTESMLISDVETRSGNSGSKFKNGDTLFARITPCLENGKTGYVQLLPNADTTAFGSTEFIVLRSKTLCPELVYLMARSSEFRDNAIKSMSGATGRQRVSEKCFEQFFIAQPDAATLEKFSGIVAQMFKQIHIIEKKNQNLRQTRDLLLPKLISGEVGLAEFVFV